MTQPQHDDPIGEARHTAMQGLAVLSTVGEAAARWAAVGLQRRAAEEDTARNRDRAAAAAARQAKELATDEARQTRDQIDKAFGSWMKRAGLVEVARLWRTAAVQAAAGDARAARAVALAQDRMRQLHPQFMDVYDRLRAARVPEAEATREAARRVWEHEARAYRPPHSSGRPHEGRHPVAVTNHGPGELPAGGWPVINDLEAAVRAEAGQLAAHISPEALDRLQREWRAAGRTPAADAAGLLAQVAGAALSDRTMSDAAAVSLVRSLETQAGKQREEATRDAGVVDDPRTPVDEHASGMVESAAEHRAADHDQAQAQAVQQRAMAQAFPHPPRPSAVPPGVAGKTPANAPLAGQRRGRGRS